MILNMSRRFERGKVQNMADWEWEKMDESAADGDMKVKSHRAKVPNGWVVRTIVATYQGLSVVQTFVPDDMRSE